MEQLNFWNEIGEYIPSLKEHESTDWKWSFKDYPQNNGIKVFSCFACGGGSTMGYKLCGCQVLGDLEIDSTVNAVYVRNHNPKYNYVMDIRDFNKLDNLPEDLYHLDILDGSPPCTTFSISGDREETWGVKKKFREGQAEQTLDDLYYHFLKTADKLKPKVVIMENVEGLLLGEAWKYVQEIYKTFDSVGYTVNHYLLKGESLGIPQKRHRVFFIGVRKDIEFDFNNLDMNFNYKPITYGEIKEGIGYNIKGKLYSILLQATPYEKDFAETTVRLGGKRSYFNQKIIHDNDIMPTIPAGHNCLWRYTEKTKISIEDVINSTTFPQDYDFIRKTFANVTYLCGMSVPPVMIKRLVNRLIDTGIFNNSITERKSII